MKDDIYKLYIMSELCYIKNHPEMNEDDLFPFDWYSIRNYRAKVEVLSEAIKEKILIKDTKKYSEIKEGVKDIVY